MKISFKKIINLFILLYNIVLVLPYTDLNPPWVYMCSSSWTPLFWTSLSHGNEAQDSLAAYLSIAQTWMGTSQCCHPEKQ